MIPKRLVVATFTTMLVFLGAGCGIGGESDASGTLESELVTYADFPAVMAFAPDGRLFYNELKSGNVRVVLPDDTLLPQAFATVEVADGEEWGLIGLAFHPEYEANRYVYVLYTEPVGNLARPRIVRFRDDNNVGVEREVIADLPATLPDVQKFHVGGNIHFGSDGFLYVSLGNYTIPAFSQDLTKPMGSILRLDADGNPAPGNPEFDEPFADPRIYAYGIRNSFDFAFHPVSGALYATENGHTNCDELNLIQPGENYGWPLSYDEFAETCSNAGEHEAIYYFPVNEDRPANEGTVAPTGIEFVSGEVYPRLGDSMVICEYNTALMKSYGVTQNTVDAGDGLTPLDLVVDDCQLDVAVSPAGTIYYSNLGEIRRIPPQ